MELNPDFIIFLYFETNSSMTCFAHFWHEYIDLQYIEAVSFQLHYSLRIFGSNSSVLTKMYHLQKCWL